MRTSWHPTGNPDRARPQAGSWRGKDVESALRKPSAKPTGGSWAADCAERVLGLFEAEAPGDGRPRYAIARARAFAGREAGVAEQIRRRFIGGGAARDVKVPAAATAAPAAGQAASVSHMVAHALGAAAHAAKAAGLAAPYRADAVSEEIRWQLGHMSTQTRAALRLLPPVGENPLWPSLARATRIGSTGRHHP
ncbi:MAG TPA: hypothetical protein VGH56_08000 [Solirubrobacteraceae bacterium]